MVFTCTAAYCFVSHRPFAIYFYCSRGLVNLLKPFLTSTVVKYNINAKYTSLGARTAHSRFVLSRKTETKAVRRIRVFFLFQFVHVLFFFVTAGNGAESGYFGPWRTCKYLQYGRERCGRDESRFRPSSKQLLSRFSRSTELSSILAFLNQEM